MQATFKLLDNVDVTMRDGVVLKTDIWLPATEGASPVLLQRTPYRKETPFGSQYISALEFQTALRRGYAIAIQDTRGRYQSGGDFVPFEFEGRDGADTIGWLRSQPFCNGNVAMFGASYVGATQVLALSENPPGLSAVAPQLTTLRHDDTWMYRGGALELAFTLLWIIESLGPDHLQHRLETMPPGARERALDLLQRLQQDPASAFDRLPVLDSALSELAPYVREWFDPEAIGGERTIEAGGWAQHNKTAMLIVAGWNDIFLEGSLELFAKAKSRWPDHGDMPDRLIIGPWSHGNPSDWQGSEWLGYAASTVDLPEENLAFFDDILTGREPASPVVRYFRSGSNSWHAAPDWPLPGTTLVSHFLNCERNSLDTLPASTASASFVSDPRSPVPSAGGATFLPGLLQGRNSGPIEQFKVEARDDVIVFTGPPLRDDLDVTGLVSTNLWVTSSAPTCDWTARLCEVDLEGRSLGVVDGIARWRPTATGEGPVEVTIRLGHISRLFKKGHRLRLQIASSNFPRFDRNPQSGVPSTLADESKFRTATQVVYSGTAFPSCLKLPIVESAHSWSSLSGPN
ncbi:CocE/NonD family hydrolase [Rhizobium sp. S163]|uniref:CocE/NonD family hydrolase n=1 Tax=Rhizobium sp. S163 TaxID=3055039 RepID=UPI0025AA1066|nr:CocE/NonD family hydrolase [Rhizobium sp. S163]MDM9649404.1 CocE/NonD family hydrolase [Rhizobium sp. S163]